MLKLNLIIFTTVVLLCKTSVSFAESFEEPPTPFPKNQLVLEIQKNFPTSYSMNHLEGTHYYPAIGFRHNMRNQWILGVGGTFKLFKDKTLEANENTSLSIWTLYHEATKIFRLYHPTYLLIGTKILYMVPTTKHSLPLQKLDRYETEIGGALTLSIQHVITARRSLIFRIDRYRGTKTQRFQGIEVAAGLAYFL